MNKMIKKNRPFTLKQMTSMPEKKSQAVVEAYQRELIANDKRMNAEGKITCIEDVDTAIDVVTEKYFHYDAWQDYRVRVRVLGTAETKEEAMALIAEFEEAA